MTDLSILLIEVALVLTIADVVLSAPQQGTYVWDFLPTPLNAEQVTALFAAAIPGETFPIYNEPPKTAFTCQGKLGYYADPQAGCQAFQRCTLGGDQISYLCPNATLFNQLVLVCDWWFNVDCSKAESYYNFANPRIYDQTAKLHDTPPPNYVAPWQRQQLLEFQRQIDVQAQTQQQVAAATVQLQPSISLNVPTAAFVQQQQQQQQPAPQQFIQSAAPASSAPSIQQLQQQQTSSLFAVPQPAAQEVLQSVNSQQSTIDTALHALEQKLQGNGQVQQPTWRPEDQKLDVTFVPDTLQQQPSRAISFLSPDGGVPHLSISPLALKPFSTRRAY